jgi:predicted nuclease of predicted toxin-antitoxin system
MTSPAVTFFIDRCLGSKRIVAALRQAGLTVEIHEDHFAPDALDVEWLPQVGEWGWVVLTKDANISRRTLEKMAVARAEVRLFILAAQNLASADMIDILVQAIKPMEKFICNYPAPFIAKIYRDHRVELWRSRVELLSELEVENPSEL